MDAKGGRSTAGIRFQNKVALVTGGSKGIGEGVVRVFDNTSLTVRNGAKVVFCARGDPPEQVIDDTSVEDLKSLLNFNLISYFAFSKYSLPHLRKTKGNIINISSLAAKIGQSHVIPYVCIKGALDAFTKALAIDEAKHGVRVNTLSPGNIWTPLWDSCAQQSGNPEAMIKGERDAQLNGRFGTLEESGQACLFLAAEATFTTGTDLLISGGAELNFGRKSQMVERTNIFE